MMNNVDNPSWNSARVKKWNWDEDKILEEAILDYPEEVEHRWEKIANRIPGKSRDDVIDHYKVLLLDVSDIEAGRTEFPSYPDDSSFGLDQTNSRNPNEISSGSVRSGIGHVVNRKKSRPWTEDEHRLFLIGLNEYGKSNWRAISRYVVTRTPKQIASHAQMYYKHIAVTNKKNKRSSIYDVTLDVDGGGMVPQPTNFTSHGGYNVTDTVNGASTPIFPVMVATTQ
ncbi:Duplicated homeodomain-like superfamily protein [Forsythia ovata]|uniref:Duplicated homeodomain-like superfamily protein n=1 Tax=Forsythia ovata TaxID=205694 RepID=A0ABD1X0X0_9LAMI